MNKKTKKNKCQIEEAIATRETLAAIRLFHDIERREYDDWDKKTDRRGIPCDKNYFYGVKDGKDEVLTDLLAVIENRERGEVQISDEDKIAVIRLSPLGRKKSTDEELLAMWRSLGGNIRACYMMDLIKETEKRLISEGRLPIK